MVAPDGRALYIALYADGAGPGAVAAFRVDRSGTLQTLGQPVLTADNGAEAIGITRDGADSWWRTLIKVSQKEA